MEKEMSMLETNFSTKIIKAAIWFLFFKKLIKFEKELYISVTRHEIF